MEKVKMIAMYLPQFHEIPENNKRWWFGFTDWVNVKKAVPLFYWHKQPKIPLNDNYYNLTDKSKIEWQINLAKKYWIYGFCFYHYRFAGKKLLEKPLELFRDNKDLQINFCLSWANEPRTRNRDGRENSVLINQKYWNEKDRIEHFDYLLNYFKDKRYIKIDNKPLFIIYRTDKYKNIIEKMFEIWNKLAMKNWFSWIYFTETLNSFQTKPVLKISESVIEFQPMLTIKSLNKFSIVSVKFKMIDFLNKFLFTKLVKKIKYDFIWKMILKRNYKYSKMVMFWWFVWWDNTPRKKNRWLVITWSTPKKFWYYLSKQVLRLSSENKFIFINAWNEWAEWAYLEPDLDNEYKYLEEIKKIVY